MKKSNIALVGLAFLTPVLMAQTSGLLPPGGILGNSRTTSGPARVETSAALLGGTKYIMAGTCDGVVNATATIQAALNDATVSEVVLPPGTCLLNTAGALTLVANKTIRCANKFATIIKMGVAPTAAMFNGAGKSGWAIKNCTIDANNLVPGGTNASVDAGNSADWIVEDNRFIHIYHFGLSSSNDTDFRIANNYFSRDSALNDPVNVAILFTSTSAISYRGLVFNNRAVNIGLSGDTTSATRYAFNTVTGHDYGAGIAISTGINFKNNFLIGNLIENGSTDATDLGTARPPAIENYGAASVLIGNITQNNGGDGLHNGGAYNAITGNVAHDNGQRAGVGGCAPLCSFAGIASRYVDATNNTRYSAFVGNVSANIIGTARQAWSYAAINNPENQYLWGNVFSNGTTTAIDMGTGYSQTYLGPLLRQSYIYDPVNLVNGAGRTDTFTLAGVSLGDVVNCGFSLDIQGLTLTAYANTGPNGISVRWDNNTGGAIDLASGILYCTAYRPMALPWP